MRYRATLRRFKRQEDGAAAVEFAIVSFVFLLIFLGIIEFGLFMYTQVVVESVTALAARSTMVGCTGCDRVTAMTAYIKQRTHGLIPTSDVIVTASSITNASDAGALEPDICIQADGTTGSPPTCSCAGCKQMLINSQPGYQGANNPSLGAGGDMVELRVSAPYQVLIPFIKPYIGQNGFVLITSTTIVKNEKF